VASCRHYPHGRSALQCRLYGSPLREPTITVDEIEIENVTWESTALTLRLTVDNPNPIGATLTRVSFDVYFLENSQAVYLAHGEREGVVIGPGGETPVSIPVTVDNPPLVRVFLRVLQG
jgi:LEA14-like dessication related protein